MKLSDFDFDLPPDRIATHPASPRDSAKLLVVDQGIFFDKTIRDLPSLLKPGDVMVFNDTKVIPARLMAMQGAATIEVTLLKNIGDTVWTAFAKPGKRLKIGERLTFGQDFLATVKAKHPSGEVELEFPYPAPAFIERLRRYGTMPLPPYIESARKKEDASPKESPGDFQDYQTVYAAKEGAVAAPTAGLHFTPELLQQIDAMGVKRVQVTLHVGAGTFLPVKVENIAEHKMHSEYAEVSAQAAQAINEAKAAGGRVIAVGTTSLRTLESACQKAPSPTLLSPPLAGGIKGGKGEGFTVQPFAGETAIFITPGYRFKCVDVLMTNFHLPKSTLFMLVSAFSGLDTMKRAYAHAIAQGYRFFSYGDGCWLNCQVQK